MQCLFSLFNCLSWLGFRDCLIRNLAFFPPEAPELPRALILHQTLEMPLISPASSSSMKEEPSLNIDPFIEKEESMPLLQQEYYSFELRNGGKTYGFLYRNLDPRKKKLVFLFSHGNSSEICQMQGFFLNLTLRLKVDLFAYEYTGYGHASMVSPSEETLLYDIEGAYRFLTNEMRYPPNQIILYGQSLGSVPSLYLSSNPEFPLKGLILHSPIASGLRILQPGLRQTLANDFFPNIEMIGYVRCPIMIIHGENDQVINIEHAKLLVGRAQTLMMVWWVEECGHEDIIEKRGNEFYRNVKKFMKLFKKDEKFVAAGHSFTFARTYERFFRQFQREKQTFFINNTISD